MGNQYYLSSNGTHIGPFNFETILKKIEAQEHQWTDYIFDEEIGEWVMLLEHPKFCGKLAEKPASRPAMEGAVFENADFEYTSPFDTVFPKRTYSNSSLNPTIRHHLLLDLA